MVIHHPYLCCHMTSGIWGAWSSTNRNMHNIHCLPTTGERRTSPRKSHVPYGNTMVNISIEGDGPPYLLIGPALGSLRVCCVERDYIVTIHMNDSSSLKSRRRLGLERMDWEWKASVRGTTSLAWESSVPLKNAIHKISIRDGHVVFIKTLRWRYQRSKENVHGSSIYDQQKDIHYIFFYSSSPLNFINTSWL